MDKEKEAVKKAWAENLLQEQWLCVNSLPVYLVRTAAPNTTETLPIILVHGLGVSSRYMLPTAVNLASHYQIYAPDLPGFGKSAKPDHVLDIAELAQALAGIVAELGLQQAVFLGNSMGCQVIAELAIHRPEMIAALVLTGPTIDPHHRSSALEIVRLLRDTPGEPLNQMHLALADYFRCGPRWMWRTFQYAMRDHIEDKLGQISAPTLVVRGSRDTIAPQHWVEKMVRLLPNAQLSVIPNAPHAITNHAAPQLSRLTLEFLQKKLMPS